MMNKRPIKFKPQAQKNRRPIFPTGDSILMDYFYFVYTAKLAEFLL